MNYNNLSTDAKTALVKLRDALYQTETIPLYEHYITEDGIKYRASDKAHDLTQAVNKFLEFLIIDQPVAKAKPNAEQLAFVLDSQTRDVMRAQVRMSLLHGDIKNIVTHYDVGNHAFVREFLNTEFYGHFGSTGFWEGATVYDAATGHYPKAVIDEVFRFIAES